MIFILLLQMISNLYLVKLLWWGYKKFNLKINLHTLPIILMCILLICSGAFLALTKNTALYLPTGALLGFFIWTINSIEVQNIPQASFLRKILISLIVTLVWPQILVFMIFYGMNYEKINIDEEL